MNLVEQLIAQFAEPASAHTFEKNGKTVDVMVRKLTLYEHETIISKIGEPTEGKNLGWFSSYVKEVVKLCVVDEAGARRIKDDKEMAMLVKALGRKVSEEFLMFVHDIATDAKREEAEASSDDDGEDSDGTAKKSAAKGGEKKD